MKLICTKDTLFEKICAVQTGVPPKATTPLLNGILLQADDQFKMSASNQDIGVECIVNSKVLEPGSIVINAKMFSDIVRKLGSSEVFIKCTNNMIIIENNDSDFKIKGISPEGFPSLSFPQTDCILKMGFKTFSDMVKQVVIAVSVDENKPILTGILIEVNENVLTMVAVDGFRMALRRYRFKENEKVENVSIIIPGKILNEVAKIPQKNDGDICLCRKENKVYFQMDGCNIVSRILEGQYLKYNLVIPDPITTKITVDTHQLLNSIERVSIMSEEGKKHTILINILGDKMILSSHISTGDSREEIKVEKSGEDKKIGFNPKYFIEALKTISDETIEVSFAYIGACIIRPIEGEDFIYVIFPVILASDVD